VIIGRDARAAGEALFLRRYSDDITIATAQPRWRLDDELLQKMREAGVRVAQSPLVSFKGDESGASLIFADGTTDHADTLYSALGVTPRNEIASKLGLNLCEDGRVFTGAHQRTSLDDCYAAGDVVTGLNQIGVAMAQAEIAAVDVHNRLREREGFTLTS
jgi:thioredoxin reductase (NADPH)